MKGEKVHFRKRFFGGFNQDDVISYIAAMSKQRNDSVEEKIKAGRELAILKDEIEQLKKKLASYETPPATPPPAPPASNPVPEPPPAPPASNPVPEPPPPPAPPPAPPAANPAPASAPPPSKPVIVIKRRKK